MTVLPRNPTELSAKALQSQNVMAGRAGSNGSPKLGDAKGENLPKFATLLGAQDAQKLNEPDTAPLNLLQVENQKAVSPEDAHTSDIVESEFEVDPLITEPENNGTLAVNVNIDAPSIAQSSASTIAAQGQIRLPVELVLPNSQPKDNSNMPVSQAQPTPVSSNEVGLRAQATDELAKLVEPVQGRRGEIAVALNAQAGRSNLRHAADGNTPSKADVPMPAKPETATIQVLARGSDSDDAAVRAQLPQELAAPTSMPQTRIEAPAESVQSRPASIQSEIAGPTPLPTNSSGPLQNAAALTPQSTLDSSADLPRLQDVKVLGTRIIESAPGAIDRLGSPTTVKVIELQLQPDTLGRIGAQLKQTGDVLEVRLEPSLAETALLLKEDRLALQRILGSLGSIIEPALVRIVDPITEQRQLDEQETVAGFESGEADQSGDQFAATEDLRREGLRSDGIQHETDETDQTSADRRGQRASGDIYI